MKASGHIILGILIFIILSVIDISTGNWVVRFIEKTNLNIIILFVGCFLFVVGLLLPDSDSEDAGSTIFYTYFFIFGWINRLLESPISKLLDRPMGHRESLHTILGITISSLFFSIIISLIFIWDKSFNLYIIPVLFVCLFLGQITHLLGDWHWEIK